MTRKLLAVLFVAAAAPAMQACAPIAVGAAAGGAVIIANDRRSTGTYIDDESIEWRVSGRVQRWSMCLGHVLRDPRSGRIERGWRLPARHRRLGHDPGARRVLRHDD